MEEIWLANLFQLMLVITEGNELEVVRGWKDIFVEAEDWSKRERMYLVAYNAVSKCKTW